MISEIMKMSEEVNELKKRCKELRSNISKTVATINIAQCPAKEIPQEDTVEKNETRVVQN